MKKYVRFRHEGGACFGLVDGELVHRLEGSCPEDFSLSGETLSLASLTLLPPCTGKIIGTGLNYRDVVLQPGESLPQKPKLFLKPPTTLILSGQDVIVPPMVKELSCEVELGVIIGRSAKCVPQQQAMQYIWGYLAANDMTASDLQREDTLWGRAKSFDTFLPVSAQIVADTDVSNLCLRSSINGMPAQHGSTSDLLRDVSWLVSYISHVMTLMPGDLIITGTPSGYGKRVYAGDDMVMEIDGIGRLQNRVAAFEGPYYF